MMQMGNVLTYAMSHYGPTPSPTGFIYFIIKPYMHIRAPGKALEKNWKSEYALGNCSTCSGEYFRLRRPPPRAARNLGV